MSGVEKRSPLREQPLHDAGQSLHDRLYDLALDKVTYWMVMATVAWGLALLEWLRWYIKHPPSPVIATLGAIAMTVFATLRFYKWRPRLHAMRLGRDGERYVGQRLEQMRENGYQVFHDICETDFNIDHVLVGPAGIFSVETKTISKPANPDAVIVYDGNTVRIDGHEPDRDPVRQAEACADRVREIIQKSTGHRVSVRPVVLFPGWWVKRKCSGEKVWVLNENSLPGFLEHEPQRLSPEDIELYADRLAIHIRNL